MSTQQKVTGFTIVELLIVVVVIAILAAITIVSYNGITARAADAKMATYASNIEKGAQLHQADKGTYGHGGVTTSKDVVLELYGIRQLSGDILVCGSGSISDEDCDAPYDKTKVYVYIDSTMIWWNVWRNSENTWVLYDLRDSTGTVEVQNNSDPSWPG